MVTRQKPLKPDQMIGEANEGCDSMAAIDALVDQTTSIERIVTALRRRCRH